MKTRGTMPNPIGSTEMQSFDLDEYRRHDFEDYVEELFCDREREIARLEATPEVEESLSPLLAAQCKDAWMYLNQAVLRRTYRQHREWR